MCILLHYWLFTQVYYQLYAHTITINYWQYVQRVTWLTVVTALCMKIITLLIVYTVTLLTTLSHYTITLQTAYTRGENFWRIHWIQGFGWFLWKVKSSDHDANSWNMVFFCEWRKECKLFSGFLVICHSHPWYTQCNITDTVINISDITVILLIAYTVTLLTTVHCLITGHVTITLQIVHTQRNITDTVINISDITVYPVT